MTDKQSLIRAIGILLMLFDPRAHRGVLFAVGHHRATALTADRSGNSLLDLFNQRRI